MKAVKNTFTTFVAIFLIAFIAEYSSAQGITMENISTVSSPDGSTITYGVRGQGNVTLVFIHGWTCNHEFWRPQIESFSKKHRVVWLDLAGHGLSSSDRQEYTMRAFGEDVAAVVNKIGGENVILVGHSMGGPVAIEAAELLGDNVIGIVGVDAFYTPLKYLETTAEVDELTKPFKEDFKGAMEQFVRHMFTPEAEPDLITSIVKQMSGVDQDMAISATYEINRWHTRNAPASLDKFSKKLRNINAAPTGKETALHKSVTLIPGVGHFVAQVKPDEFNETLNKLISEFQAH